MSGNMNSLSHEPLEANSAKTEEVKECSRCAPYLIEWAFMLPSFLSSCVGEYLLSILSAHTPAFNLNAKYTWRTNQDEVDLRPWLDTMRGHTKGM
jgi:hypothetical protein